MLFDEFINGLTPEQATAMMLEEEQKRRLQQTPAPAGPGFFEDVGNQAAAKLYTDSIMGSMLPQSSQPQTPTPTLPTPAGPGFFEDVGNQAAAKLYTDSIMGSMLPQSSQPQTPTPTLPTPTGPFMNRGKVNRLGDMEGVIGTNAQYQDGIANGYTGGGDFEMPPGFFEDVFGQAARGVSALPVELPGMGGLGRNEQGPLAPGQHRGDFTLGNHGVRIWNGDNGDGMAEMTPGAGYTHMLGGVATPIPHPTDALFGQRTAVIDPYTNPIVWQQDRMMDKEQGFRREMAQLANQTRLDEASIQAGGRIGAANARERKIEDVKKVYADPLLPDTVKVAQINQREDLDPVDRNRVVLDLVTSKVNPTTKGRDAIPHTDAKGQSQLDAVLTKIPNTIPPEEVLTFLDEWRGLPKESILKRITDFKILGSTDQLEPQQKKEYDQLVRLGIMPELPKKKPVSSETMRSVSFGGGSIFGFGR